MAALTVVLSAVAVSVKLKSVPNVKVLLDEVASPPGFADSLTIGSPVAVSVTCTEPDRHVTMNVSSNDVRSTVVSIAALVSTIEAVAISDPLRVALRGPCREPLPRRWARGYLEVQPRSGYSEEQMIEGYL